MTSTGSVVRFGSMSGSHLIALGDKLQNLLICINELFFQSCNLNRIIFILS